MNVTIMSAKEANEQTSKWVKDHTEEQINEQIKEAIAKGEYSINYHFLNRYVEEYYISFLEKAGYKCLKNEMARLARTYIIRWEYVK